MGQLTAAVMALGWTVYASFLPALAVQAGDRIPLDTERGYHVEWDMATPLLARPACPTARGFYFCPMEGRLRVAGTVELGGLTLPPSATARRCTAIVSVPSAGGEALPARGKAPV